LLRVTAILGGVADNGTNTGSRCTSDEASLQATAEYRSKSRTASASD
jgi:hypothetical protein